MLYLLLFCAFILGPGALQRHSYFSARSAIAWAWEQPETDGSPGLPFKNKERKAHVEKYLIFSET